MRTHRRLCVTVSTISLLVVFLSPLWPGLAASQANVAAPGQGDVVNVKDYGAKGDGRTDDTAAIQAAITAAKAYAATQTEAAIIWPRGAYNVTSLNYVGASRVANIALGAVNIYGTSVGGTSIISYDGGLTVPTGTPRWQGYFAIQIGAGGSYKYGIKMSFVTNCVCEFSGSGAYSIATFAIDYSWDNVFSLPNMSNSANNASVLLGGPNGVHRNKFTVRLSGNGNMAGGQTGIFIQSGLSNSIEGDVSAIQTGIDLGGGIGTVIIAPYFETVKTNITTHAGPYVAIGTTILGGTYEAGTNGAAFVFGMGAGGSQHTTVISPRIKGVSGGSNRTAFAFGNNAYAVNISAPDLTTAPPQAIDTLFKGTWRGANGFTGAPAFESFGSFTFDASGNAYIGGTATGTGVVTYTWGGGLQLGAATGGDKGSGTINVSSNIYRNGTAYANPDYALEYWTKGRIVQFADRDGAKEYDGLWTLARVERYMREHFVLPRVGQARERAKAKGTTVGLFDGSDAVLTSVEEQMLYILQLHGQVTLLWWAVGVLGAMVVVLAWRVTRTERRLRGEILNQKMV